MTSEAFFKNITFKKGPHVSVLFTLFNNQLQKVTLKEGCQFEAFFFGQRSEKLEEELSLWLELYSSCQPSKPLNLELNSLSAFRKQVYQTLQMIQLGQTCSYQELAMRSTGSKAYRAVGSACKNNPFPLVIPCHRVILAHQKLGQFNGGVEIKKRLLEFEKAAFR